METDKKEMLNGTVPEPGIGSPKQAAIRSMTEAMTGVVAGPNDVQNDGEDDIEVEDDTPNEEIVDDSDIDIDVDL